MPGLTAALGEVAGALTAAGVPTVLDRGRVPVPGGLLAPQTLEPLDLGAGYRASVLLWLVCGDADDAVVLDRLTGLLSRALTVLEPDDPIDTTFQLAVHGTPLPAFRIPFDLDFQE